MAIGKRPVVLESLKKTRLMDLLQTGKRIDGRGLQDYRKLVIETNVIEKANGSAKVSLGNTQVLVGVKVEIGTPFPDTPDSGILIVNAEISPLSSPYAEPGPPDENVIELARVVDRGIRESKIVDMTKLGIIPGKKVRAIFVDVSVLNSDGNLFDASSCAAISALATSKIAEIKVEDDEPKVTDKIIPLQISTIPVSVTMGKIGDVVIVDPSSEEESIMDTRITLVTDSNGNLVAGQKGLPSFFGVEQVLQAAETSMNKGTEIREMIKEVMTSAKA